MKHWNNEEFTHWIYGLKEDQAHLDECAECRARAANLKKRRTDAVQPPEVSWEFLAAQRRSIYARMEAPQHSTAVRLVASLAMLIVVALLSVNIWRTRSTVAPLSTPADDKLYSDLVSIEQSNEPRAIRPIEKLFQQ
jgi:hypothetical protein